MILGSISEATKKDLEMSNSKHLSSIEECIFE